MKLEPELILDSRSMLGEGPSWDSDRQKLLWIDGIGCKIHEFDPLTGINTTFNTGISVGCAIPRKTYGLISPMKGGIYIVDMDKSEMSLIQEVEPDLEDNRLNDGKCDSMGRLWFGSMSMSGGTSGSLYNFTESSGLTRMFGGVGVSNGIAWNDDDTVMYYIDTRTKSVARFEFDLENALLGKRKYIINISDSEGVPDGMTIDEEGMLWIAHFRGSQVSRWDPKKGKKIVSIKLPAPNVTSCTFGGVNLDELYITTARKGIDEDILKKHPYSGGLFRVKTNTKGKKLHKFG